MICWFCHWDGSCEPGANDPSRYVLSQFAQSVDHDYYAVNKALYSLQSLREKCDEYEVTCPYTCVFIYLCIYIYIYIYCNFGFYFIYILFFLHALFFLLLSQLLS